MGKSKKNSKQIISFEELSKNNLICSEELNDIIEDHEMIATDPFEEFEEFVTSNIDNTETVISAVYSSGIVDGTSRLNIREEPNTKAKVLTIVPKFSELRVNEHESTKDWCKVLTQNDIEGYCMRQYVILK